MRPPSSTFRLSINPWPGSPRQFSLGIRQSSKMIRSECSLSKSHGQCRNRDAPAVQHLQAVDKSLAGLAKTILFGDSAIFENDLARIACAHSQFALDLSRAEARSSLLDNKR